MQSFQELVADHHRFGGEVLHRGPQPRCPVGGDDAGRDEVAIGDPCSTRHLNQVRRHLLNAVESLALTGLRETRDVAARVFPLLLACGAFDAAVAAAYDWEWPTDDLENEPGW